MRTVEEWAAHPHALDELLRTLRTVTDRYEAATPRQRWQMCDRDPDLYALNERVSGRVPVPLPRLA